jgi:hypothetical protein
MNNEPRIKIRYVTRENGVKHLQVWVGVHIEKTDNGERAYGAQGWIDVPEYVERIEPK